ncbi:MULTISPECIES: toll/interleukin-1 receptor domain-containing protein [Aeromonas]|uniref:Toll/interleukin-1 receptor domain-containing protein n=1 Tax=Aeromonas caviae TaxID=648 RepID=A0AAW9F0G7_AERCA|nr:MULTISPECIES: toll/interleukin-1 receptor domain-containing protein [Aeromonas]MBP4032428.1 toll/interleukin-1 receptor domain-containing protein [Aeromonas sp. PrichA-15]MDX7720886.1 toll/interleukin-1 receptor domain-containing protein [Aeromonas caviae]GJA10452.1 hypothetical protein KAM334_17630 [Aeromonas caviae]GJA32128.1 hypothetical protein KAM341_18060 [Aeromonas caviae]GJA36035.1 hypothetical protein KAM342_12780 [Aeromonas caviae]
MAKNNNMLDVFISYRREGGATVARLLYEVLKSREISAFMDAETLSRGDYEKSIQSNIKNSKNFLLILAPGTLDSEWVQTEVKFALQYKKNIIPVFVNGVDRFPDVIPNGLGAIKSLNAIAFNHENFENNMNKLMSWLETKHNLLLKAYLDFSYEKGEGKLIQSLMDSLSNILPQPVLIDLLKEHLKLSWTDSDSTNATPGNLLKDLDTWTLKNMTKYLGVEHKGIRENTINNIDLWLRGMDVPLIKEDKDEEFERYYRVQHYLEQKFKSRDNLFMLKALCETNIPFFKPKSWKSSADILFSLVDEPFVCNLGVLFKTLELSEGDIKELCDCLIGDSVGRRTALIEKMEKWVNYQDE